MQKNKLLQIKSKFTRNRVYFYIGSVLFLIILVLVFPEFFGGKISYKHSDSDFKQGDNASQPTQTLNPTPVVPVVLAPLDTVAYDQKLTELANNPLPKPPKTKTVKDPKTGEIHTITIPPKTLPPFIWPVKTVYPNAGAILPFSRIVAFYGNFYSKKMGALGAYPEGEMLAKLDTEVEKWKLADPTTPVVPALHYIAVVAQGGAGTDGKYRSRMPFSEIDKVLKMAEKRNAIVFLDVQVGFSNLQAEVPLLEKYLKLPNVHLGIDPEFSMKSGIRPGKIVGTIDASDINYVTDYLSKIVKENNLPPKVFIVHRYTGKMVTNYKQIKIVPEVQFVMDMDGWGVRDHKLTTYHDFIYKEPVQFTGFKLFYKNDLLTKGTTLMTPAELMKLNPRPIYIQYQ